MFDAVIDNSKNHLGSKVSDACGYPSDILLDRLMQRLVEIGLPSYVSAIDRLSKTTGDAPLSEGAQINCGTANMEAESGHITFTPMQWVVNQLEFLVHWAVCLIAIIVVTKGRKINAPTVMVFGIGEESLFNGGSDEQFVNYCRNGPIDPLRNGRRFLLQSVKQRSSSNNLNFSYSRQPLIGLLREARIGFFGRLRLAINHIFLLVTYFLAIFRVPQLSLLGRDFAYSRVVFELDRRKLIDAIIITTSNFARQPLWSRVLRGANVHMVWYAQNFKPIVYKSDELDSDVPSVRWIRVDTHWVWTSAFAEYLRSLGLGKSIKTIGPILWYLPVRISPDEESIKIVIFDVSPYHNDIALKHGEISNYNHPDNLFSFIRDVVSLKVKLEDNFDMPVSFSLKTKRGYGRDYDKAYFDYLEALAAQGVITLEHHAMNMYSLISESHLVVVYPFSSPAYIADFLGVPSIYYDPTGDISRHDFGDPSSLIDFADSPESLLKAATLAIKQSLY